MIKLHHILNDFGKEGGPHVFSPPIPKDEAKRMEKDAFEEGFLKGQQDLEPLIEDLKNKDDCFKQLKNHLSDFKTFMDDLQKKCLHDTLRLSISVFKKLMPHLSNIHMVDDILHIVDTIKNQSQYSTTSCIQIHLHPSYVENVQNHLENTPHVHIKSRPDFQKNQVHMVTDHSQVTFHHDDNVKKILNLLQSFLTENNHE
jgi:flagellar biosynthesis/type III secretory pathway protein FliH